MTHMPRFTTDKDRNLSSLHHVYISTSCFSFILLSFRRLFKAQSLCCHWSRHTAHSHLWLELLPGLQIYSRAAHVYLSIWPASSIHCNHKCSWRVFPNTSTPKDARISIPPFIQSFDPKPKEHWDCSLPSTYSIHQQFLLTLLSKNIYDFPPHAGLPP